MVIGDILVYRDSHHLSNTFVEWFAPILASNSSTGSPRSQTCRNSSGVSQGVRRVGYGNALVVNNETAQRIAAKEVSVEVLEHMVDRADRLDGQINAIIRAILVALEQRQMRLILHSPQVSPSDLCMAFL